MMIGKRIGGRYQIISRLGEGGMAIVYKARDLILDRLVAVKVLRSELSGDEEFVRRFHREAESVASLSHKNIVAIYDIGEEEDCYYIVMEYIQGMTLKEFIKDYSPIAINESVHIMQQITQAIAHAHDRGIVHRDIKPHNILIDETERVKVTDFGIALAVTGATITYTHSIMGSAHYLSPEQARGGKATIKSDIYALGIVMFELFTGRLPFPGSSPVSVALKHLKEPMPLPTDFRNDIPQSVENIMIRALAKNPELRYPDAADMYEDLLTALKPERASEPRLILDEDQSPLDPPDPDDEKTIKITPIKEGSETKKADPVKKEEGSSKKRKKKNRAKRWLTVFGILLLLITAGLAIGLYLFPKIFYVADVQVPDVSGKSFEEARQMLENRNLTVSRADQPSKTIEVNQVIRQNPKAGEEIKTGSEVKLYVSSGPDKVKIDNYVGSTRESIEQTLKDEGFKSVNWKEEPSDEVDEGEVISQNPKAGTDIIPAETDLELTVSTGPPQITLRNLVGMSRDEVDQILEEQGLTADFVTGDFSETIDEGDVLSQDPVAGSQVNKGSTVIISLSKGKARHPKEVIQPITVEYPDEDNGSSEEGNGNGKGNNKNNENKQPIHVQIYYTDANHDNALFIEEEITESKTYNVLFTINPGEQGFYRVVINDSQTEEGTVDYPED